MLHSVSHWQGKLANMCQILFTLEFLTKDFRTHHPPTKAWWHQQSSIWQADPEPFVFCEIAFKSFFLSYWLLPQNIHRQTKGAGKDIAWHISSGMRSHPSIRALNIGKFESVLKRGFNRNRFEHRIKSIERVYGVGKVTSAGGVW